MSQDLEKLKQELELDAESGRVLETLASNNEKISESRRAQIRAALNSAANLKTNPQPMKWNRFWLILPVGAVAVILAIAVYPRNLPPTPSATKQVAVATRNGFGVLPNFAAAPTELKKSLVASPAAATSPTLLGVDNGSSAATNAAAPSAESLPGASRSAVDVAPAGFNNGTSGSGSAGTGVLIAPTPMPPRCLGLGCGEYLPPRVVYKFTGTLPAIPSEIKVYRIGKNEIPAETATAILKNLGVSGFGAIALQSFSFTESGDNPLTWNYDGGSGNLYFSRNGNYAILDSRNYEAPTAISDPDALKLAADFLRNHGIDASKYGNPTVERNQNIYPCKGNVCPMMGGAASAGAVVTPTTASKTSASAPAGATIARPVMYPPPYWSNTATVNYPALRDGAPIFAADGSATAGIALTIGYDQQIVSGNILLPGSAASSLYPARSSADILADALHGGLNPYYGENEGLYTPEQQKRRPVITITLNSAALGYADKYDDGGSGVHYLLPVVGWRGTMTDQYGNKSDWGTIVPVVNSSEGNSQNSNQKNSAPPGAATLPAPAPLPPTLKRK